MGRVREYDQTKSLNKAMQLFWANGYSAVSLKQLLDTMGILNGSFYNAYGNKRQVFIEALKCYENDFSHKRDLLFSNPKLDFSKKIRLMIEHALDRQKKGICPKGCFLFNSVQAEVLNDAELRLLVRDAIDRFEFFLAEELKKSIQNREVSSSINPKIVASLIVHYIQGLMSLSVLEYSDNKFRQQTEYFLNSLCL